MVMLFSQVSIPELNDSRWIGMCIYNVVLLGSLGAILVMGTDQTPAVTYLMKSVIVFTGATVTQCLIFVPKVTNHRFMPATFSDYLISCLLSSVDLVMDKTSND